jgi:hypothetical protein
MQSDTQRSVRRQETTQQHCLGVGGASAWVVCLALATGGEAAARTSAVVSTVTCARDSDPLKVYIFCREVKSTGLTQNSQVDHQFNCPYKSRRLDPDSGSTL